MDSCPAGTLQINSFTLARFSFPNSVYVYGLFYDTASSFNYTVLNGKISENNELERLWKEAVMVYSEILV
jgi:hypothetical protein